MAKKRNFSLKAFGSPSLASYGFSFLLFLAICLNDGSTAKIMAMLSIAAAVIVGVRHFSRLRERFHLPMAALTLMVVMCGVSTFYAIAGKFALSEMLKILVAVCAAIIMLAVTPGDEVTAGHSIAVVVQRCTALVGLVSIDLISTRVVSGVVLGILRLFTTNYLGLTGVEEGTRLTSMFVNPNIFAACMAIGVMLSLGLVLSTEDKKERTSHLVCLYINALSFVLAFSMGAVAFIAVGFVAYLILERKERRSALFMLMVQTLLLVFVATVAVSLTSFDAWDGFQPIPLLCVVAGAAGMVVADRFLQPVARKLSGYDKVLWTIITVAIVGVVAFALVAYQMTGSISLASGETLSRSVYLEPGEYVLDAELSGSVAVTVETQNRIDTMMHTSTVLYSGELSQGTFTVPEDSLVVYLRFNAAEDVTIARVTCAGVESEDVPLGYKLLPNFIANRLQGLFANQNAIQRTVFFEDGLKLFARNPILGSGLGCFENGIKSVQSFFYETKYAHNHYIQMLAETGLIGLLLFMGVLIVSAIALWGELRKKEKANPLAPALAAALIFIAGHAIVEVDLSVHPYLPLAYAVFALINLTCGGSIAPKWFAVPQKNGVLVVSAGLICVYACCLFSNMSAVQMVKTSPTFENMKRAAEMDPFEDNDHKISYLYNSYSVPEDYAVQDQTRKFVEELSKEDSNTVPILLADYYFKNGEMEKGFAMVEKYVRYVSSDQDAWNQAYQVLIAYYEDTDLYREGFTRIAQFMNEWNEGNLGHITIDETTKLFYDAFGIPCPAGEEE